MARTLKVLINMMCGLMILVSAHALATPLEGKDIRSLVNGKKIFLKIPVVGEFPLVYERNGVVRGDGSAVGLAKYFAPKDEGRWWILDDKLCQKWGEWYKGRTICFVISDVSGKKFRWTRDDGRKGKARIE